MHNQYKLDKYLHKLKKCTDKNKKKTYMQKINFYSSEGYNDYTLQYGGEIKKITDHLYLGNVDDLRIIKKNIKYIISIIKSNEVPDSYERFDIGMNDVKFGWEYRWDGYKDRWTRGDLSVVSHTIYRIVDMYGASSFSGLTEDDEQQQEVKKNNINMINTIKDSYEIIDNAIKHNEDILVHCRGGQSRSPTVIAGYLIKKLSQDPNFVNQFNDTEITELVEAKKLKDAVYAIFKKKISTDNFWHDALKEYETFIKESDSADTIHTPTVVSSVAAAAAASATASNSPSVTTPSKIPSYLLKFATPTQTSTKKG
jgi:Dual specificity phosphatase, catalytic domain